MAHQAGSTFIEKTKYHHMDRSDQARGVPQPPLELPFDKEGTIIDLPRPRECASNPVDLRRAIEKRTSIRKYAQSSLSLSELSLLLWCTQGVKEVAYHSATFRTVPSAGARHALETYLLVNRVDGLRPGIYRFLAIEHKLIEIDTSADLADKVAEACFGQMFVKTSAVTFIWTAVPYRMTWRYGERGYRYLHLDAGHACQNLYLSAESIDCGVCAIAAFSDDHINPLVGIDGQEQFVIYVATVGKTP